jgi:hypothetical protein
MRIFRTVVVAVLLGAFFSPAVGLAKTEPRIAPAVTQPVSGAAAAPTSSSSTSSNSEGAQYAQREQQSQDAQNFKGGAVYLYFGSGVVLALIVIILLLL